MIVSISISIIVITIMCMREREHVAVSAHDAFTCSDVVPPYLTHRFLLRAPYLGAPSL